MRYFSRMVWPAMPSGSLSLMGLQISRASQDTSLRGNWGFTNAEPRAGPLAGWLGGGAAHHAALRQIGQELGRPGQDGFRERRVFGGRRPLHGHGQSVARQESRQDAVRERRELQVPDVVLGAA